jgi:hypothetical protein
MLYQLAVIGMEPQFWRMALTLIRPTTERNNDLEV